MNQEYGYCQNNLAIQYTLNSMKYKIIYNINLFDLRLCKIPKILMLFKNINFQMSESIEKIILW